MPEEKEKVKKDKYKKALIAYGQAMKDFHKGEFSKAVKGLEVFLEKYSDEKELVDRAKIYIAICQGRQEKETISLKTFDDYYQYGVYKINLGEYGEALKLLKKASENEPDEGKIFYLLASTYCLMEDEEECLENLKKAIQIDKFFSILAQNEEDFEALKENKKFKLITKMA